MSPSCQDTYLLEHPGGIHFMSAVVGMAERYAMHCRYLPMHQRYPRRAGSIIVLLGGEKSVYGHDKSMLGVCVEVVLIHLNLKPM